MGLVLAASRFAGLATWSLWLDEALTLADALAGHGAKNPLGYRLFGWFYGLWSIRPDERVLRLPAALAGVCVLAGMWWCWKPLARPGTRALALVLTAAAPWHLYWSQNARFYTLAQLAALLGGTLVVLGVSAGSLVRLVAGLGLLALGAATHPTVAFFAAGLLLAPWALRVARLVAPDTRIPWRFLALLSLGGLAVGAGWGRGVWERWDATKGAANPLHFALTFGYSLTPLVGLAWVVGSWRMLRRGDERERLACAGTALALAAAAAASLVSRMSAQYVFALLPWLALGAARALEGLRPRIRAALAALLLLPLLAESALYWTVRRGDRPAWRDAFELVFSRRGPGDLLLAMEAPVGEYYLDPHKTDLREWRAVTWLDAYRPSLHEPWLRWRRPIWFVVNHEQLADWPAESSRALRAFLERSCSREASFELPWTPRDLDVHVYRWAGAP